MNLLTWPETTPCRCCGEMVPIADHLAMIAPPGRDALEAIFTQLNRANYHSPDETKTVPFTRNENRRVGQFDRL